MASVSCYDVTESSIYWKVTGLGYAASAYSEFRLVISGGKSATYTWTSNNSSNTTGYEVTGLKANTYYKGVIYATYNGVEYTCGSDSATTLQEPPEISDVTVSSITKNSCKVVISCTGADYYDYKILNSSGSVVEEELDHTSKSCSFSGLDSGTTYRAKVIAYNDEGYDVAYSDYFETDDIPVLSTPVVTCTPSVTSVVISWQKVTGAGTFKYTLVNTSTGTSISGNFVASTLSGTCTGLTPNTTYKIFAYFIPSDSDAYEESNRSEDRFTTKDKPTFAWSTTPNSGSAFSITASDWSTLQNTINEIRTLKGYSSYSFSYKATKGGTLTAAAFNEARQAISGMGGTNLPSAVSSGSTCYASYFTALQNSLNNITIG